MKNLTYLPFKERCQKECTRDAIFLFQRKVIECHNIPEGWESEDGVLIMAEEDAFLATKEEQDLFKKYTEVTNRGEFHTFSLPYISFKEMYDRMKDYDSYEYYFEYWITERVFLTREEGEHYGKCRDYNYPDGWRVYCVCAEGKLAELIKET